MVDETAVKQYISCGKNLTLLNGKRPIIKNWTKTIVTHDAIYKHDGNLGWVLGEEDLVIDVDVKNNGEESYKKLYDHLISLDPSFKLHKTVNSPSGGFHVYLKIPNEYQNKTFRKTLTNNYPGIDFLTKGCQCVIASSETEKGVYEWYDDFLGGFEQADAPENLLEMIISNENNGGFNGEDFDNEDQLEMDDSYNGWSRQRVTSILAKLNPSMGNNEWVKVGMALHDWHEEKGLELWETWSKKGDNHIEGETSKRWESFTPDGGVTMGTIHYLGESAVYDENMLKIAELIKEIKTADEKTLHFEIIPKIKKLKIGEVGKETIAKTIRDRHKELTGVTLAIRKVRASISNYEAPPEVDRVTGEIMDDADIPDWCKSWVYVNSHAGFVDKQNLKLHKPTSFNLENGKHVPANESGTKLTATKYVSDNGFVQKLESMAYLPTHEGLICKIDNSLVLNLFDPKTIPVEANEFTEEGLKAIETVEKHIKMVFTTDENTKIFVQWLAHQIQYPGKKLLWSPIIQATQGVGKSFFGDLLRACLGDVNVGTVSPTQVTSQFNGWATDVVVNVLEELRVKGHNRYEVVNALKPLITDTRIQINIKSVNPYNIYNTTNYICFTNFKDSLLLGEDDRRWWVIFAPIKSLEELKDYVGEDVTRYFTKLFAALEHNGPQLRKWLLEYPITDEFLKIKQAPMTDYKKALIATEETSLEGLQELKALILKGGKYFNEEVISSSDLFKELEFQCPELEFKSIQVNQMLKRLGYMIFPTTVKIDGKTRRLWSKLPMKNHEARLRFNEKK